MPDVTTEPSPAWSNIQPNVEELETRVQRLEEVVASLCDTRAVEQRLRASLLEQLQAELRRFQAPAGPAASPAAGELQEPQEMLPERNQPQFASGRVSFFREVWWDIATLFRMIRDPVYRISTVSKVVPVLALLYVTVWSWFSGWLSLWPAVPILGYVDDVIVIYIGLKVLGRELRRYREFKIRALG